MLSPVHWSSCQPANKTAVSPNLDKSLIMLDAWKETSDAPSPVILARAELAWLKLHREVTGYIEIV
jgi:hypothetical protein